MSQCKLGMLDLSALLALTGTSRREFKTKPARAGGARCPERTTLCRAGPGLSLDSSPCPQSAADRSGRKRTSTVLNSFCLICMSLISSVFYYLNTLLFLQIFEVMHCCPFSPLILGFRPSQQRDKTADGGRAAEG